jgi:hypothetical protein
VNVDTGFLFTCYCTLFSSPSFIALGFSGKVFNEADVVGNFNYAVGFWLCPPPPTVSLSLVVFTGDDAMQMIGRWWLWGANIVGMSSPSCDAFALLFCFLLEKE